MTYKHKDFLVNLKENDEWRYIAKEIVSIIGREKYLNAIARRDAINGSAGSKTKIHLATVLHEQHYFTYTQLQDLIVAIFSEVCPGIKKISLAQIKTESVGSKFIYTVDGATVEPVWIPKVRECDDQAVLTYQDYFSLQALAQQYDDGNLNKNVKECFLFRDVVYDAFTKGASDVHLIPKEDFYHIFFRINGDIIKQPKYIMPIDDGYDFAISVAIAATAYTKGKFSADNMLLAQEGRIEYSDMGVDGVDVRLEFIPDGSMGKRLTIVSRLLRRQRIEKADFAQKGFNDKVIRVITDVSKLSGGLVMVSGETGSGKSTLVADIMTIIDSKRRIYTIEDPIEYFLAGDNITQHQIYIPPQNDSGKSKQMGFSEYAAALKRADPDVVNIGEMRKDPELVSALFEMANAGQLIFTTVHIRSAFDIYHALDQVFNIPQNSTVPLILFSINLKLSKKLCERCRKPDDMNFNVAKLREVENSLPYEYKTNLHEFFRKESEYQTYLRGSGCPHCKDGYSGRIPIYEYFRPDVEMIEWILEKKPTRYQIEQKACSSSGIGENKLNIFIERLIAGDIDTSDDILQAIL